MLDWIETADAAYRLIEPLKSTDPERYSRIAYAIEIETFCPIWILYDQSITLTNTQNEQFKARIQANKNMYSEFKYVDGTSLILNA